jgi:hypothetical protein
MPKPQKRSEKAKSQQQSETLKGWKQISEFLGEPVSVVKRWAAEVTCPPEISPSKM